MSEIVYSDVIRLQQALSQLTGPGITQLVQRASYKIGLEIENELKRYPKSPSYPLKWASERQRRWYFWHRRKEGLPIGYTRTSDPMSQKLGHKWTTKPQSWGAIVGNPVTYAPYVQSHEYQQPMHEATGWITDKEAADEIMRSRVVEQIIAAEMRDVVDRAFRAFR